MTNEEVVEVLEEMWELLFQEMRGKVFDELNALGEVDKFKTAFDAAIEALKREQQFLDAGYKNEEVEFYIGGRKFIVREVAQ